MPRGNIIIDEDGVGGGVVDEMEGVKGFVANHSAISKANPYMNYSNIKTECYFKLATLINDDKMGCYEDIKPEYKELIIEELEQIAQKDADKDQSIKLIPKEDIKANIGHSPDFADALMMRMYFEVNVALSPYIAL